MSVYEMRESTDMQRVLVSLYGALKDTGVEFDDCSVQVVDEEKGNFESYYLLPGRVLPLLENPLRDSAVYEAFRGGGPVYRRDLDEEDPYNERTDIKEDIRSVLDVPFSRGTIAINSVRPDAFSEADIGVLEQFAAVLSEAYTRFEDIGRIEESEDKYHAIFEQAADAVVLIDAETGALVEFNDRAHENLGYTREEFQRLQIPDFEVIESREEVAKHIERIIRKGTDTFETKHRTKDGEIRDIYVSCRAISVAGKAFIQSIWRDITELKQAEQEREGLIEELQEALSEIKTLRGIIPICASCKKIRDDEGYWHQVEVYVHDHTEAEFSHGFCPECAKKLYPQYYRNGDRSRH